MKKEHRDRVCHFDYRYSSQTWTCDYKITQEITMQFKYRLKFDELFVHENSENIIRKHRESLLKLHNIGD